MAERDCDSFKKFGGKHDLYRQECLREKRGRKENGRFVYILIGPGNHWRWQEGSYPRVDRMRWLRPVFDDEVYCSNRVCFAGYYCGHNIFFYYKCRGFRVPSTCPFGDSCYVDPDTEDYPEDD